VLQLHHLHQLLLLGLLPQPAPQGRRLLSLPQRRAGGLPGEAPPLCHPTSLQRSSQVRLGFLKIEIAAPPPVAPGGRLPCLLAEPVWVDSCPVYLLYIELSLIKSKSLNLAPGVLSHSRLVVSGDWAVGAAADGHTSALHSQSQAVPFCKHTSTIGEVHLVYYASCSTAAPHISPVTPAASLYLLGWPSLSGAQCEPSSAVIGYDNRTRVRFCTTLKSIHSRGKFPFSSAGTVQCRECTEQVQCKCTDSAVYCWDRAV
jgi:hypothetical protein